MRRNIRAESAYVARLVQQADPRQLVLALTQVLGGVVERPTFGELADSWLKSLVRVCPDNERRHIEHLASLRKLREGELTVAEINEALDDAQGDGLHAPTLNKLRSTGKLVVAWAQGAGQWLSPNPFALVRRRKEIRRIYETLSIEEVCLALDVLDPDWRRLVRVAVLTGARPGELVALHPGDVDLERGTIHIHRSHERDQTKTGKERLYAVPPCAERDLREALALGADVLFPSRRGGQRSRDSKLSRIFQRALARAGICRRVRFYDLRHTSATLHREAGCDPLVIRRVLGHASRNLTDDLYSHLSLAYIRRELGKLCLCGECPGHNQAARATGK